MDRNISGYWGFGGVWYYGAYLGTRATYRASSTRADDCTIQACIVWDSTSRPLCTVHHVLGLPANKRCWGPLFLPATLRRNLSGCPGSPVCCVIALHADVRGSRSTKLVPAVLSSGHGQASRDFPLRLSKAADELLGSKEGATQERYLSGSAYLICRIRRTRPDPISSRLPFGLDHDLGSIQPFLSAVPSRNTPTKQQLRPTVECDDTTTCAECLIPWLCLLICHALCSPIGPAEGTKNEASKTRQTRLRPAALPFLRPRGQDGRHTPPRNGIDNETDERK